MNTLTYVQAMEVTSNTIFESVGDAFAYGIPLSLFGFATVFAVLALIWGILSLFKVVFYTIPNARKNPKKAVEVKKAEPKVAQPIVTETVSVQSAQDDSDVEAIIAAIEAYRSETTGKTGGFRVVSFKKRI